MMRDSTATQTLTEPRVLTQIWKTSCFAWVRDSIATNDLTDEKHPVTPLEQGILSDLRIAPVGLESLIGRSARTGEDITPVLRSLVESDLLVPVEEDESGRFSINRVDIETGSHCNAD